MEIGKLNRALEERVKSLCVENRLCRDLAQTNEATTKALRCHLEQVLTQVKDKKQQRHCVEDAATELIDNTQSCCGSNFDEIDRCECSSHEFVNKTLVNNKNKMCKRCGKEESCVLLLPCRHLYLGTVCRSSLHICPIYDSAKNGGEKWEEGEVWWVFDCPQLGF